MEIGTEEKTERGPNTEIERERRGKGYEIERELNEVNEGCK